MNQQAKVRAQLALILAGIVLALFVLAVTSCAALKSSATVAGGGAAGAAVGSIAGPGGAIAGGAIGAGAAHMYEENDQLRDGDLVGKGALEEELKRRGEKIGALEAALRTAEPTTLWETLTRFFWRIVWIVAIVLGLRMLWFERDHLRDLWAALKSRDPFGAIVSAAKAFFGASNKASQ